LTLLKTVLLENNLEEGLKLLTQREKRILFLYYLAGYRDREIAKHFGTTQQTINYLRKKGINKLKIF